MVLAPPEEAQALREIVPVQQSFGVETRHPRPPTRSCTAGRQLAARGRRARLLRADVGLRGPGADRPVARPLGAAVTGCTSTRDARCSASRPRDGRVTGVVTGEGEIATGVVVNARGPWGDRIGRMVGVEYPLVFSREHEAIFERRPRASASSPVISDVAAAPLLPSYGGGKVLVGEGWPKEKEPVDPETYDDGTDEAHLATNGAEARSPRSVARHRC